MNLVGAFLKLIRLPNLLFIGLTQILFYFCIIVPHAKKFPDASIALSPEYLGFLIIASVCIAAGGYIINDYFDLNIDKINKPNRFVIERVIKRRWAIVWHILLSVSGLLLSFYIGWKIGNPFIALFNLIAVVLLWFYSTTFKKQLLIGNIVISLLTAWVVLVLYVCELRINFLKLEEDQVFFITGIFKFAILYGGFAFIISIIREVVKDIEDMEGDIKYNCRTMPISWGIPVSKVFITVWLIVLSTSLAILMIYALQVQWWWLAIYLLFFVLFPQYRIFRKLKDAKHSHEFSKISSLIKLVMFTGLISLVFFKWYN